MEYTRANIEALLKSPATSYWLRDAIEAALQRDPVDALNDAEVLVLVCQAGVKAQTTRAALNDLVIEDRAPTRYLGDRASDYEEPEDAGLEHCTRESGHAGRHMFRDKRGGRCVATLSLGGTS